MACSGFPKLCSILLADGKLLCAFVLHFINSRSQDANILSCQLLHLSWRRRGLRTINCWVMRFLHLFPLEMRIRKSVCASLSLFLPPFSPPSPPLYSFSPRFYLFLSSLSLFRLGSRSIDGTLSTDLAVSPTLTDHHFQVQSGHPASADLSSSAVQHFPPPLPSRKRKIMASRSDV